MHWANKIAEQIIANAPNKQQYVCAAGISPSGSVHIGNFRDIVTAYFVCRSLRQKGKSAKLLFSWDEFDRFRKVPVNVDEEEFKRHIGKPYSAVPDPHGCCESYAKHFEREFEEALITFGIEVEFRYQTAEYHSGRYAKHIVTAIEKRECIFDILDSFRTQDSTAEERANYYPVSIYCSECGKDNTTITAYNSDTHTAAFSCKCGHGGDFCFDTDFNCKLSWKVDWPMRWLAEGVDFEPGGKDHSSPTGSYQTSRIIAEKVYGISAPLYQGYEFIGIKGETGKMSGSSGLNLTPKSLFNVYQPEVILWLYAKTDPMKAFNFCFDDEILRQYFEFDKMYNTVMDGKGNEFENAVIELCQIAGDNGVRKIDTVPMAQLASFGSVVDFDEDVLETVFDKIGTPYVKSTFAERSKLARYWLENCSPESVYRLLETPNSEYYNTLDDNAKTEIALLREYLAKGDYDLDGLQAELYAIPKRTNATTDEKVLKKLQGAFFKNVYQLLIGKEKGPRLYLFLFAIDRQKYLHLLEF